METEELQQVAFEIILYSGEGRTLIHEAFEAMRKEEYEASFQKLEESNDKLVEAHKAQTTLLQKYSSGDKIEMEVIMVHAQDHLMTTMTLREVALEMLELYKVTKRKEA